MLPPTIIRLSSAKVPAGATVTIEGHNFLGVAFVGINGLPMKAFKALSSRTLRAVLPPEATSGYVSVTGTNGTAQSPKPLLIGPSITDFSPAAALPGDMITLTGHNLTAVKAVNVGAYEANFTVLSQDQLQLVVPPRAVSALIGVHGLGYSVTSAKYLQLPVPVNREYALLKRDTINLKAAMNGLSKHRFTPAIQLLSAVREQINRYFSSASAGMADALDNLDSALAVLTNATLSSTQRSVQAEAFALAAAADIHLLAQNFGVVTYHRGIYAFTVPTDVYSVYIAVSGGDGGDGGGCDEGGYPGQSGESRFGTFAVTPGQSLIVSVDAGERGDCVDGDGGNGGGASVTGALPNLFSIAAAGGAGGAGASCACGDNGGVGHATIYW